MWVAKLAEMAKKNPIGVSNRVERNQSRHYLENELGRAPEDFLYFSATYLPAIKVNFMVTIKDFPTPYS